MDMTFRMPDIPPLESQQLVVMRTLLHPERFKDAGRGSVLMLEGFESYVIVLYMIFRGLYINYLIHDTSICSRSKFSWPMELMPRL